MRRLTIAILLAVTMLVTAAPAVADHSPIHVGTDGGQAEIEAGINDAASGLGDPGWEPPAPEDVGVFLVFREHVDPDDPDDTGWCYTSEIRVYPGAAADAAVQAGLIDQPVRLAMQHHGPCPEETPDEILEGLDRFAAGLPMPPPDPRIPPGRAITGLPAFLEPNGQTVHTVSLEIFGSTFTATFHHVAYDVNWGDGTPTQRYGHTQVAGAYPDGEIRHAYQDRGHVIVSVTQYWAGWWSYDGVPGAIAPVSNRPIPGTLWSANSVDLPINEVQGIRTD